MNEQLLNIQFVQEVEKRPCLYDYNLPEYSRRDITENAWNEVGKIVNLSGSHCREKWKNLRAVFVRQIKPALGGSAKKKKPYYLTEAMRFTIPFIKTLNNTPSSYHDVGSASDIPDDEEENVEIASYILPYSPVSCPPSTSSRTNLTPSPSTHHQTAQPHSSKRKKNKRGLSTDKTVMKYFTAKKDKQNGGQMDSRKMFLLSLLDDVRSMSDGQMRKFKRRVLEVVEEILDEPQSVHSFSDVENIQVCKGSDSAEVGSHTYSSTIVKCERLD